MGSAARVLEPELTLSLLISSLCISVSSSSQDSMSVNHIFSCGGCQKCFKSQKSLLSHQQQTACIWVLQRRNEYNPGKVQNLLDASDQEDDPPHAHLDDVQNQLPGRDDSEVPDEVFALVPGAEGPSSSASPSPSHRPQQVPLLPPSPSRSLHDPASRAPAEETRESEPSTTTMYADAGKILHYDADVCKQFKDESMRKQPLYTPFKHKLDWEVARWAKEEAVGSNTLTRLLSIPGVVEKLGLSYHNSRALDQTIDGLPGNPPWLESTFTVSRKAAGTVSHPLCFRDPVACISALYGNIDFIEHMAFEPVQEFSDDEKSNRMYNEMHTGDWWWNTQAKLPDGSTVVLVILSSDKMQLSSLSGDQEAHPVYLTIGNISKELRHKLSYHLQIIVTYLPIIDLSHLSDDVARVVRARMFHSAMSVVMKSLKTAGRDGVHLTSGDGAVRDCYPVLAVYIADYPEQCLVCCMRYMQCCPKCTALQKETLRTVCHASKLPTQVAHEEVLKEAGFTSVTKPFWESLPHANIHDTISPDILHQLIQGMIKHLIEWVTTLVSSSELDARLKWLPEAHGMRHFANGISGLSQISGPERKEMCKQLLGCLVGKVNRRALRASRALFDFLHIAQYETHSDEMLVYLKDALAQFHKDKNIFIEESVCTLPNFNFPKLHMLEHYVPDIKSIGMTDNSNTEFSERLHIDYAKHAYDTTNKKDNYIEQMTRWLDRSEKVSLFDLRTRWHLNKIPPPPRTRSRQPRKLPPRPSFPKNPTEPYVTFAILSSNYHAPLFACALHSFIATHCCTSDKEHAAVQCRNHDSLALPFNWVEVWHRASFAVGNVQIDSAKALITAITVNPKCGKDNAGRFDTVLVDTGDAEPTGITGLRVAHVRVLFRIPPQFNDALFNAHHVSAPGSWPLSSGLQSRNQEIAIIKCTP
ncbi:hypothetical protein EVG20_g10318 [Dentipellis fragilis]|uniref:DUF6830 domain-containing protein n=1 Tax=Dentipellis fragilis TaxID=205917 RepID=A0A4Y9XV05_9AGAM|nr:hypothetical protein EVG20_g10318 [Dentipellis fragilis]